MQSCTVPYGTDTFINIFLQSFFKRRIFTFHIFFHKADDLKVTNKKYRYYKLISIKSARLNKGSKWGKNRKLADTIFCLNAFVSTGTGT